jgi:NADH:ubiquinone oxidoreductase subunit 6 (subunit J)
MDNLLHHPLRVALTLSGFLCALSSLMFLGGVPPLVIVMPYIPIIFQFIGATRRYQVVIGWIMLTLLITSFSMRMFGIEPLQSDHLIVYSGPLLLLLAGLHLFVSERKNRTSDARE